MARPSRIDWNNLEQDYARLGSQSKVAEEYGCCQQRVTQKMKELGMPASKDQSGSRNGNWRGGRRKSSYGYIMICSPDHPYKNKRGEVFEHRLVMEQHIGRYLKPYEVVHHINGIRDDNRLENLELTDIHEHQRSKHLKGFRDKYNRFHNTEEEMNIANATYDAMQNQPTPRQKSIMDLWLHGYDRGEIARRTNMTRKNVHFHLVNLVEKGLIPEFRKTKFS